MTNDTTTLNGSLKELGETMAANLTAQGVSSTWDEGLMTLASKILDISPSPTPTVDSLTLAKTAGKQILSYADKTSGSGNTEYCTVTATALDSNNQGVSGQSVVFKVGTTTVATETTDSNGEASYTYTSQGSGDVVLSAECSSLIQTYSIQDCWVYDDASSDKKSKYGYSNVSSLTHNSDHYEAVTTTDNGSTKYYAPIYVTDMADLPSDYEISLDWKIPSMSTGYQGGFNISDNHITTYSGTNELLIGGSNARTGGYYRVNGNVTHYNSNTALPTNTWLSLYLKVQGTSATFSVKNGSTTLYSNTQTLSNISSWKKFNIIFGGVAQTGHFKNLKIKPL